MNAGTLIRTRREAAGLTQEALARRLGVSQPSVARLESQRANPTVASLAKVLAALGYELALDARKRESAEVDESQIARHLRLSPAERLSAFEVAYRNVRETLGPRGAVA